MYKNPDRLKKYKLIVMPAMQEYVPHELNEVLKNYVKNGGHLMLAWTEYAFKFIRWNDAGTSYRYFTPGQEKLDPMYKVDKSKMATESGMFVNLEHFFGAAIHPGVGFCFLKETPFSFTNKNHPWLKGMDEEFLKGKRGLKVSGWSMGSPLKETKGKLCFEGTDFSCDDLEVLGYARVENDPSLKFDCDYDEETKKEYWGKTRLEKSKPKYFYSALMHFKQGKGKITIVPSGIFEMNQNETSQFIKNVAESL